MEKISIIVPVYNEETNILPFIKELNLYLSEFVYELIFVLDPCTDNSEKIICKLAETSHYIKLISMSRRFGQPMAILAGLEYCTGNCAIIMDVDLQNPPSCLPKMIKLWKEGYQVVLPKLKKRGDNLLRTIFAKVAYKLIDVFSEIKMPRDVSDFRLLDREVIDQINLMEERHGFLRGMVAYAGYKVTYMPFNRPPRLSGQTKYNRFFGSFKIGGNGVFAYSSLGLFTIFNLGIILAFIAIFSSLVYLLAKLFQYPFPWGFPTIVILILLVGAINLFGLAILGQYIQRIYEETRKRPRFIIKNKINLK